MQRLVAFCLVGIEEINVKFPYKADSLQARQKG